MRFFGLQETDEGKPIRFGRAILRTIIKLFPFELNHLVVFLPTPIWGDPNPGFRSGFIIVEALIILYFVTMFLNRGGQRIHDIAAGTIVINANYTEKRLKIEFANSKEKAKGAKKINLSRNAFF